MRALRLNELPAGERTIAVYERLREWIVAGELEAGSEISQLELTRLLGVSRTPLREALRLLTRDGLVEATDPHRLVRITDLSMTGLDELYGARLPMEAMAIWNTVPRMTMGDIGRLRDDIAQIREPREIATREAHRHFHRALWSGMGAHIQTTLWVLLMHAERYQSAFMKQTKAGVKRKNQEHREIVDACEMGDRPGARDALVSHLSNTALTLMERRNFEPVVLPGAIEMARALEVSASGDATAIAA